MKEIKQRVLSRERTLMALLRTELAELDHLYQTAPVGLCLVDRDLRFIRINRRLAAINGRPVADHIGRTLRDVIPGIADTLEPVYRRVIETGEPVLDFEVQGTTPRWGGTGLVSYHPLKSDDGTVYGVSTVVQDITDRKRAEEALREREEHLRRLLETTNAIPWEANAKTWEFTYVGPQAIKLLGYPPEQWYEKDFWPSHIHPDDREYAIDLCEKSSRRYKDYEFEYRMVAADGRIVWIHDIVSVVSVNGEPETLRGFMIDITEWKQVEDMLKKQQAFLRQVIDINPNFIFAKDREGRFTLVNQSVADAYGTTVEDLIGKTDAHFNPSAEEVEFFRRMDLEVMDTLQEKFIPEEPITDAQGRLRWLQTVKRPIIEDGTSNQVLGSATDITERKRSEEALRQSETALRNSQRDLRMLAGRLLSAQEEERRRLARELHDDLTQRLAVLAIEAASLEKTLSSSPSMVRDRLRRIKEQMMKLSADVHGISRQLHPSILDDLGLVSAIESECAAFSERDGVRVTFIPDHVPAALPKDVSLCLYRVTQESLRNIAKHAQAKEAYVTLACLDDGVLLTIQDCGVGFDIAQAKGKAGLGLASMEERVRLLQGSLSIHSKPGQGTIIEVHAPLACAVPTSSAQ
ncbi:MAG: PAS domain S-box protein [Candidatus Methylomirabilales bacterium]